MHFTGAFFVQGFFFDFWKCSHCLAFQPQTLECRIHDMLQCQRILSGADRRYVPPANKDLDKYLDERLADAKRLHAAPYASEWNFGASSPVDVTTFFSNVASFESRRIAYTGWQYKK